MENVTPVLALDVVGRLQARLQELEIEHAALRSTCDTAHWLLHRILRWESVSRNEIQHVLSMLSKAARHTP